MESKAGDLEGLADTTAKALKTELKTESDPKDPTSLKAEDVPDLDEDDLDDLDGLLSNF